MKRKHTPRMLYALLAAGLLAVGPVAAYAPSAAAAETTVTVAPAFDQKLEQSLQKVYQLVPELKELTLKDRMYTEGSGLQPSVWVLSFDNRPENAAPDSVEVFASAHLTLHAETGQPLSFHIDHPDWHLNEAKMPDRELARKKAAEYARQLMGAEFPNYRMATYVNFISGSSTLPAGTKTFSSSAGVTFERLVKGVPLLNLGTAQFMIDTHGHLTGFDWFIPEGLDAGTFPDPAKALRPEEARKAFVSLLDMQLVYQEKQQTRWRLFAGGTESVGDVKPVLKYEPRYLGAMDAVTGKAAAIWPSPPPFEPVAVKLSPRGGEVLQVRNVGEAAALLKSQFGVDVSGMELREQGEMPSDWPVKHYAWVREGEEGAVKDGLYHAAISVDAKTNRVVAVNLDETTREPEEMRLSREEALKAAVQQLERYLDPSLKELQLEYAFSSNDREPLPDWVDPSKLTEERTAMVAPSYSFSFTAVHEGIPVTDKRYYVQVNGVTGQVQNLTLAVDGKLSPDLPDSNGAVSARAAAEAYLSELELELYYIWPEYRGQRAPAPVLVYKPKETEELRYVDAHTGQVVKVRMEP